MLLWLTVVASLAPLRRMTSLAQRIRDGARGRRLSPTRPRTDLGRTAGAIDEMLDALESAENHAQQAETAMQQFLADASHDLRTPLPGVIAGSEQVLREPGDRAVREERLVAVVREARRAARLVDDVLLMARLDQDTTSAPPTAVTTDLLSVLDQEIHHLQLRYPSVRFRRSAGADGAAGPVRYRPGVPERDRERIFERFVRLDIARQSGGSGLGLPIGRAVVERHGGSVVCVAPAPGTGGGLFVIRLPLQVPAERAWRPEPVGTVSA